MSPEESTPIIEAPAPLEEAQETASIGVSAGWGVLAKFVSMVANFLIGVMITRALGASGKGVYTFIQQMVGILCVVFGLGLSTSNVFFVASKRVRAKTATMNTLLLASFTTIVASVVLFLFLAGPFAPSTPYDGTAVALATALFCATTLYTWLGAISIGLDGLKTQAKSSLLAVTFTLLLVVLFWRNGWLTATTMLLIGVFAQASGAIFVVIMERKKMFWAKPDISALKTMIPYSAKSYAVDLVGYLHLRQDVLILGWLAPMSSIGIYSIAVGFAEIVRYVPSILNAALFARISQPDDESGVHVSALLSRTMVLFVGVSALAFALIAPFFIPFAYGEGFTESVTLFLLLLPGTVCISLAESSSALLFSKEIIYWPLATIAVALNVILNFILVPLWGIAGAAVASSITYTLYSLGIVRLAVKHSGLRVRDFFILKKEDIRILRVALLKMLPRK